MALTVNSKVKDLLANEECCREVDRICPGLTTHPYIGVAKSFTLSKCAQLLPETLTPAVMGEIAEMLERVTGKAEEEDAADAGVSYTEPFWNFDEVIDRDGTNSVKYGAGSTLNPYLPDEYIPMWIADMDFACPEPVLDAMRDRLDRRILGYSVAVDPDYYASVMDWEKKRHDIDVAMDSIVFSAGVIRGMEEAVRHLTKEGDSILLNTPGYHPFDDSIKLFGRTPVYSELINDGTGYYTYDWDDMEAKAADPKVTLFFLCSPHNPTGRVWTEEELRRVADIMFRNNVFIFCDEIWHDHIRKSVDHISFMKLFPDKHEGFLVATAPSKTFNLAGNQLANLLIPNKEMASEWTIGTYTGHPNPLAIDACKAAYTHCAGWADAMKEYIDENFAFMADYIKTYLPKAVFRVPEGTYLGWINLRAYGLSDAELNQKISSAGLFIEFGNEFVRDGDGFVRFNVACPRSMLHKALRILSTVLEGKADEKVLPEAAPAKLAVGDTMADFRYDAVYAPDLYLSDSLGKNGAVVLFARYVGCPVCQLAIRNYIENAGKLTEKGKKIFIVTQSSVDSLKKFVNEKTIPVNLISDPEGKLYKQFEVEPAKSKLGLAGKGLKKLLKQADELGIVHGENEGNELQLPAVFVIGADRKVEYVHYAKNLADMPGVAEIAGALKQEE